MPEQITKVNGHTFSFASTRLTIGAQEFERFTAITYEHSLEAGELRGAVGAKPEADTFGYYRTRGTISMYVNDWRALRRALAHSAKARGAGYMQERFNITISYGEDGEETLQDELRGCRVIRASRSNQRSTAPLIVDVDLYIREIVEDGDFAVAYPESGT